MITVRRDAVRTQGRAPEGGRKSVGIIDHAMQSMAIRGFIAHNRESGAYTLTDSGCAALTAILEDAEIGITA
jgi:hypothetical protein